MGSEEAFSRLISARVWAAIAEAGEPYTQVGERAGIPKSTFERKIKGRGPFTTDDLAKVGAVLGIDPADFVADGRWPDAEAS